MNNSERIVITGIGLVAPNGNNLQEFREALLQGKSGLKKIPVRYMESQAAGTCEFDEFKYQAKKNRRRGTRAGSIAIYCAHEALNDAKLDVEFMDKSRLGVFIGITEHGNVETEEEVYQLHQNQMDTGLWSHHHNPRTVANAPAGEVTLNLGSTGPHYTIGAACAGGNAGIIQGLQQILLGECDVALAGGVSESTQTFGIFAAFKAQGALGHHEDHTKSICPLDINRNGTVIGEGGCLYVLEKLTSAQARGAKIYGEIVGYAMNSDASDYVNPNHLSQARCVALALKKAGLTPDKIDLINLHATGTGAGDVSEVSAIREAFGNDSRAYINFTKGHIGHTMGAAGALELAGNIPSFTDGMIHPGINVSELDPECSLPHLVLNESISGVNVEYILNNSFGMLGINSVVIVKKFNS